MKYFGFCDPSGGSSDSMTLAVARASILGKKAVLVGTWEKKAPFNPDIATEEFAGILAGYRLTTVVGDRYSAEWVATRFRSHGITYAPSQKTKSEIFLDFLALVNSDRVRIPANRRLRAQLVSLERRVSRTGRDAVDHPRSCWPRSPAGNFSSRPSSRSTSRPRRERRGSILKLEKIWTIRFSNCRASGGRRSTRVRPEGPSLRAGRSPTAPQ